VQQHKQPTNQKNRECKTKQEWESGGKKKKGKKKKILPPLRLTFKWKPNATKKSHNFKSSSRGGVEPLKLRTAVVK
jgi:hypothetical protein